MSRRNEPAYPTHSMGLKGLTIREKYALEIFICLLKSRPEADDHKMPTLAIDLADQLLKKLGDHQ